MLGLLSVNGLYMCVSPLKSGVKFLESEQTSITDKYFMSGSKLGGYHGL